MEADSGFDTEAYKLNISDIAQGNQIESEDGGSFTVNISIEEPEKLAKDLNVKMVWIQGTIIDVTQDETGKVIVLTDETGSAYIHETELVPGGDHPKIAVGSYIGILGQILQVTPRVGIKAVKVMCYVEKPLLKKMWPDEVRDLKAFLLNSSSRTPL